MGFLRKSLRSGARYVMYLAPLFLGLAAALLLDPRPLTFESRESTTVDGGPVFNSIDWQGGMGEDVWVMRQSHGGPDLPPDEWDRIAIRADKSGGVPVARFSQHGPGSLDPAHLGVSVEFKVSCGLCHPNGPRAIRPRVDSRLLPLNLWDRARLITWNLRIKSYGRVEAGPAPGPEPRRVPFVPRGEWAGSVLDSPTCARCHRDAGPFARGELHRANFLSIRFLVESGEMPPLGMPLPEAERRRILLFTGAE